LYFTSRHKINRVNWLYCAVNYMCQWGSGRRRGGVRRMRVRRTIARVWFPLSWTPRMTDWLTTCPSQRGLLHRQHRVRSIEIKKMRHQCMHHAMLGQRLVVKRFIFTRSRSLSYHTKEAHTHTHSNHAILTLSMAHSYNTHKEEQSTAENAENENKSGGRCKIPKLI